MERHSKSERTFFSAEETLWTCEFLCIYLFRVSFRNICAQIVPSWAVQWFSTKGSFDPQETFNNVWRHLWWPWLGISWVEVRNAANQGTMHRKVPTSKDSFTQNVNSSEKEKPRANGGPFGLAPISLYVIPGDFVIFLVFWFKIMSPKSSAWDPESAISTKMLDLGMGNGNRDHNLNAHYSWLVISSKSFFNARLYAIFRKSEINHEFIKLF